MPIQLPTQAEAVKALVDQVFTAPNPPAALTVLQAVKTAIDNIEITLVARGRQDGMSFQELAQAAGVTRQSLNERFGHALGAGDALQRFGVTAEMLNTMNGEQTRQHPAVRTPLSTTQEGYINRNNQRVQRRTSIAGNDHNQKVYVLNCGSCGHTYGANGSDIHLRRCPNCMNGAAGLDYE